MAWKLKDMDNKEAYQIAALFSQLGRLGTRPGDQRDRFLDYQEQNAQIGIQQELMKEAQKEQEKGLKGAMGGGIGKMLGGAAGFALGGPVGAGIGAGFGNAGGQLAGGGTIADPASALQAGVGAYGQTGGMGGLSAKSTTPAPSAGGATMQAPQMISAPTPSTQATPQPTVSNPLPQVTGPVGNDTVMVPQQGAPLAPPKQVVAQQAPQPQNPMNQFMSFLGGAAKQMAPQQQQNNLVPRPGGGYNYYPNGQQGYGGY